MLKPSLSSASSTLRRPVSQVGLPDASGDFTAAEADAACPFRPDRCQGRTLGAAMLSATGLIGSLQDRVSMSSYPVLGSG